MEFLILGPLEARVDGRALALGGAKQRALLALLLLHRNEVVSTDRLIDGLWGEAPPATAVKVVQVYVSRLRRLLWPSGEGRGRLLTRPPGYALELGADELDLDRFEALVERAGRAMADGDPAAASAALGRGLAMWRGTAAGRPGVRALRPGGGRAPRGAAAGGAREPDRGRPRPGPRAGADRRAGRAGRRAPAQGAPARLPGARPLPRGPPGRGAGGLPRRRGGPWSTTWGSSPAPSWPSSSGRSCATTPRSRSRPAALRPHRAAASRRSRRPRPDRRRPGGPRRASAST